MNVEQICRLALFRDEILFVYKDVENKHQINKFSAFLFISLFFSWLLNVWNIRNVKGSNLLLENYIKLMLATPL